MLLPRTISRPDHIINPLYFLVALHFFRTARVPFRAETIKALPALDAEFTQEELGFDMADADASIDVEMLVHERAEDADDAQGGSASDVEIIVASAKHDNGPDATIMQFDQPIIISQEDSSVFHFSALGEALHEEAVKRNGLAVIVPPAQNRWEYKVFQENDEVDEILEEYDDAGFIEYLVLFWDGSEDVVSLLFRLISSSTHATSPTLLPPSPPILILDSFHITTSFSVFHPCLWTTSSTYHPRLPSDAPVYIN